MRPADVLLTAGRALWHRRRRTALVVLGIAVGVASLIAVLSLVEGSRRVVVQAAHLHGANEVTFYSRPTSRGPDFLLDESDVRDIRKALSDAGWNANVIWAQIWHVSVEWAGMPLGESRVRTPHGDWYPREVDDGRPATRGDFEGDSAVCFIRTYDGSPACDIPIGQNIEFIGEGGAKTHARLCGLAVEDRGATEVVVSAAAMEGQGSHVDWIEIQTELADVAAVQRAAEDVLLAKAKSFSVYSATRAAQASLSLIRRIGALFICAAVICIAAGSIGAANIMAASMRQRMREMAVRKVEGARRVDILAQVLCEGAIQASVGAALGVAGGMSLARLLADQLGHRMLSAAVPPAPTLIAAGAALGCAAALGVIPAWRAASVDPVEALRWE